MGFNRFLSLMAVLCLLGLGIALVYLNSSSLKDYGMIDQNAINCRNKCAEMGGNNPDYTQTMFIKKCGCWFNKSYTTLSVDLNQKIPIDEDIHDP
jgi:hypothetical protein